MPKYKCQNCGFEFRETQEPAKCENCERQGAKKKPAFLELVDTLPHAEAEQGPVYHWACKSCGFKFVGKGVPVKCPNCERQNAECKGFKDLTTEARLQLAAMEAERKREELLEKTPNVRWTKPQIIAWCRDSGLPQLQTCEIDGEVCPIQDAMGSNYPTKDQLLDKVERALASMG